MANQKKYLDQAGVAQLYKVIEDQLNKKLNADEVEEIIYEIFGINDASDEIIHLYGGSASDLI